MSRFQKLSLLLLVLILVAVATLVAVDISKPPVQVFGPITATIILSEHDMTKIEFATVEARVLAEAATLTMATQLASTPPIHEQFNATLTAQAKP